MQQLGQQSYHLDTAYDVYVFMGSGAFSNNSESHRLKAVAPVTDCKPYSGHRPARWISH